MPLTASPYHPRCRPLDLHILPCSCFRQSHPHPVRTTYEDLQIQTTSLPHAALDLDPSAAAGVTRRITREATSLLRRTTATTVPIPLRIALSDALSAHATAINICLPRSAHGGTALPSIPTTSTSYSGGRYCRDGQAGLVRQIVAACTRVHVPPRGQVATERTRVPPCVVRPERVQ